MKMSINKKKAFTLVELLVVIAILAILASVSIVGYLGFTEKANKSVDEQMCTQYNTLLDALSVNDDDVTLKELMQEIEANDIRFQNFETKSKDYEFAYDKGENTVVLLDSSTGDALFPKNYAKTSNSELWSMLYEDSFVKGVDNYLVTENLSLTRNDGLWDKYISLNGNKIGLDLNNKILFVKKETDVNKFSKITLTRGYLYKTRNFEGTLDLTKFSYENEGLNKVQVVDESNHDTTKDFIIAKDSAYKNFKLDVLNLAQNTTHEIVKGEKILTFTNKTFINYSEAKDKYTNLQPRTMLEEPTFADGFKIDNDTTIKFENCKFIGTVIDIEGPDTPTKPFTINKLVVNNCEFTGLPSAKSPIYCTTSLLKSYEITNNYIDASWGFNLPLPRAGIDFESKISGNTFKLFANDRKDVGIMINNYGMYTADTNNASINLNDYYSNLLISGNKMLNGRTIFALHGDVTSTAHSCNLQDLTLDQIKNLLADKLMITDDNDGHLAKEGTIALHYKYTDSSTQEYKDADEVTKFIIAHKHHYGHA